MTTAPHPPSTACARRGCKAPDCAHAYYRYRKQLDNDIAHGRRRLRDATQTRVHLQRLHAHKWNQAQVAMAAGVSISTVSDINHGRRVISRKTAAAILAIRIGPPPVTRTTDPIVARRQIQALAYIGYAQPQIAQRTGLSQAILGHIHSGTAERIQISTAEAISRVYRELRWVPGPSRGAMQHARRADWHGPLAWDDIEDPNCEPENLGQPSTGSRKPRGTADPARVMRLTNAGKSAAQIARDLGVHERTVIRARGRARQMAEAA